MSTPSGWFRGPTGHLLRNDRVMHVSGAPCTRDSPLEGCGGGSLFVRFFYHFATCRQIVSLVCLKRGKVPMLASAGAGRFDRGVPEEVFPAVRP